MQAETGAMPDLRLVIIVATVACIGLRPHSVAAMSTGIGGYSGKRVVGSMPQICNACHGGGIAPDVRFEGPMQLDVEATGAYRFVIKSNAPDQDKAGFNVAVGNSVDKKFAGAFTPGAGERAVGSFVNQCPQANTMCEITHSAPVPVDANQEVAFEFMWTAPAQPGTYILYGAGNSVNTNALGPTGDQASATTYMVEVVAAQPTETVTDVPTVTATPTPTPPATATLTPDTAPPTVAGATPSVTPTRTVRPTNTRRPTPTGPRPCVGDCNHDGKVSTAELVVGVSIALDNLPIELCGEFDVDGDGAVFVDELIAGIDAAISGCQ